MKQTAKRKTRQKEDMLTEYDFSKGIRGKYARRYAKGTNVIVLAPDLIKFFPDSESVNEALHTLVKVVQKKPRKASA
ncbi:MAG: hypothetical protein ACHQYP_05305 [Nitrospiria bacterium]